MPAPPTSRPALSESPWFWVYLFTNFALIVLLVMRPRVQERQAQIERKIQGRERAREQAAGQSPQTQLSTPDDTLITLTPLYVILGVVWLASFAMLLRRWLPWSKPSHSDSTPPGPPQ